MGTKSLWATTTQLSICCPTEDMASGPHPQPLLWRVSWAGFWLFWGLLRTLRKRSTEELGEERRLPKFSLLTPPRSILISFLTLNLDIQFWNSADCCLEALANLLFAPARSSRRPPTDVPQPRLLSPAGTLRPHMCMSQSLCPTLTCFSLLCLSCLTERHGRVLWRSHSTPEPMGKQWCPNPVPELGALIEVCFLPPQDSVRMTSPKWGGSFGGRGSHVSGPTQATPH